MKKYFTIIAVMFISLLVLSCNKTDNSLNDRQGSSVSTKLNDKPSLQIVCLQDESGSSSRNFVGTILDNNIDAIVERLLQSGGEFDFGIISDSHKDQLRRLSIPPIPKKKVFHRSGNPLIDERNFRDYKDYEKKFDSSMYVLKQSINIKVEVFKKELHDLQKRPLSTRTDFNSAFTRAETSLSEINDLHNKVLLIISDCEENMNLRSIPEGLNAKLIIVNPFPPSIAKQYNAICFEGINAAIKYIVKSY